MSTSTLTPTTCKCVYVRTAEQYATYKRYIAQTSVAAADAYNVRMKTEEQTEAIGGEWDPL